MILRLILLAFFAAVTGCDKSHNPVSDKSDDTVFAVGSVFYTKPEKKVSFTLQDGENQYHIIQNFTISFHISDMKFGNYSIIPDDEAYYFYPDKITINEDNAEINLIGYVPPKTGHIVLGFISGYSRSITQHNFTLSVFSDGMQLVTKTVFSSSGESAYMISLPDIVNTLCTMKFQFHTTEPLTPFQPDSLLVDVNSPVVFQDIIFTFQDYPRYTVSGCFESKHDINGLLVTLEKQDSTISPLPQYLEPVSIDGSFRFDDILGGRYLIKLAGDYEINNDAIVNIDVDDDVQLSAIPILYNGSTNVTLLGRVVDDYGAGIPGATVARLNEFDRPFEQTITDSEGNYVLGVTIRPDMTETIRLQASKPGIEIAESIKSIIIQWKIDVKEYETEGPVFVGVNYAALTPADYFLLEIVSRWMYRRSSDGTTTDVDVTVSAADDGWYRFSPRGPADFTEFRIAGTDVTVRDSNGATGTLLKFGVAPGTTWKVFPDQQYQVWNGKFIGLDEVTVPAGIYECAVFEAGVAWDSQSDTTYTLWFAPGIGMVKMTRETRSQGDVLESRVDELTGIE